jgi:hypothetical protein
MSLKWHLIKKISYLYKNKITLAYIYGEYDILKNNFFLI